MSRLLGIDHGTVRIGLAVSDELQLVASPLKTLETKAEPERQIAQIVKEKGIEKIILGMPLHMSGAAGEAAQRVEKFADRLAKELRHEVPIELVDERLSSVEAEAALSRSGITGKRERQEVVDQLAAVVILQDYLNSQRGPEGLLLPEDAGAFSWEEPGSNRRRRSR